MNTTQSLELQRIPSNYFSPKSYVRSEPSTGLLSTPQGKRLIAIPDLLIDSINSTLLTEAGEAAYMAFYTFGLGWGQSFYERTHAEIEVYYDKAIAQMNAPEYFATLQQLWGVHGLGKIVVDFLRSPDGILLVTVENSGISKIVPNSDSKSFSIEAGFLAGWFSAFTRQQLTAQAIQWDTNYIQYQIEAKT